MTPDLLSAPQLPKNKELASKMLDNSGSITKIKTERGWIGAFWGASSHVPHNIAALLIVILAFTGILYTFIKLFFINITDDKTLSVKDFWAIITPMITLAIGYLFGEKTKKNEEQ